MSLLHKQNWGVGLLSDPETMAGIDRPPPPYEPLPRSHFFSSTVEGQLYVWGGYTDDLRRKWRQFKSTVCKYDYTNETWIPFQPYGTSPPGLIDGACASDDHHLYAYGGHDGYGGCSETLRRLHIGTSSWKELAIGYRTKINGPRKKWGCRMVTHADHLVLFGGVKPGEGWTNELYTFDLKEGEWSNQGTHAQMLEKQLPLKDMLCKIEPAAIFIIIWLKVCSNATIRMVLAFEDQIVF